MYFIAFASQIWIPSRVVFFYINYFKSVSGLTKILGLDVIKAGVTLIPFFSVEGFTKSTLKNPIEKILGSVLELSRVASTISDRKFESMISLWTWIKILS